MTHTLYKDVFFIKHHVQVFHSSNFFDRMHTLNDIFQVDIKMPSTNITELSKWVAQSMAPFFTMPVKTGRQNYDAYFLQAGTVYYIKHKNYRVVEVRCDGYGAFLGNAYQHWALASLLDVVVDLGVNLARALLLHVVLCDGVTNDLREADVDTVRQDPHIG